MDSSKLEPANASSTVRMTDATQPLLMTMPYLQSHSSPMREDTQNTTLSESTQQGPDDQAAATQKGVPAPTMPYPVPKFERFILAAVSSFKKFKHGLMTLPPNALRAGEESSSTNVSTSQNWLLIAVLMATFNLVAVLSDTMLCSMMTAVWFDYDIQGFQWSLAGPSIGAAAAMLTAGQAFSVYPFKRVYVSFALVVLLGIVAPTIPQISTSMKVLFWARLVFGVGLGGQQLGAMVFFERESTTMDKVRRDAFIFLTNALGSITGPIIGALFAHRGGIWKMGFLASFLVASIVFGVTVCNLKDIPIDRQRTLRSPNVYVSSWRVRLSHLDTVGCLLSFVGILIMSVSLNLAGIEMPWSGWRFFTMLTVSGCCLLCLPVQQICTTTIGLFPRKHMRNCSSVTALLLSMLAVGVYNTILPYTMIYWMTTRPSPSPIKSAFLSFAALSGPHLLCTVLVFLYLSTGFINMYPFLPSMSVWTVISTMMITIGTILLVLNSSLLLPGYNFPIILKLFALSCIGFWSAIIGTLSHARIDSLRSPSNNIQRTLNRAVVLFFSYLGTTVLMTISGQLYINFGRRLAGDVIAADDYHPAALGAPTENTALLLMFGYAYNRLGEWPAYTVSKVGAVEKAFSYAFFPVTAAAGLGLVISLAILACKIHRKDTVLQAKKTLELNPWDNRFMQAAIERQQNELVSVSTGFGETTPTGSRAEDLHNPLTNLNSRPDEGAAHSTWIGAPANLVRQTLPEPAQAVEDNLARMASHHQSYAVSPITIPPRIPTRNPSRMAQVTMASQATTKSSSGASRD